MNIFVFDNAENRLRIEEDSILFIKEFAALWDINRNKCKEDKKGKRRILLLQGCFHENLFQEMFYQHSEQMNLLNNEYLCIW